MESRLKGHNAARFIAFALVILMPLTEIIFNNEPGTEAVSAPIEDMFMRANMGNNAVPLSAQFSPYASGGGLLISFAGGVAPSPPDYSFVLDAALVDLDVFGFLQQGPGTGDVTPLVFNGETIAGLYSDNGGFAPTAGLHLIFFGTLAQGFFDTITVNGVTLTSASAAFSLNTGVVAMPNSEWYWNASNPVPGVGTFAGEFEF